MSFSRAHLDEAKGIIDQLDLDVIERMAQMLANTLAKNVFSASCPSIVSRFALTMIATGVIVENLCPVCCCVPLEAMGSNLATVLW